MATAGERERYGRPRSRGPRSYNGEQGGNEGPRRERRYRPRPRRRVCPFCQDKTLKLDYKKADMLQNYISDRGKILGRRATGLCARHQRELAVTIKRARQLALLPFIAEQPRG